MTMKKYQSPPKYSLTWSPMTDKVYWINGRKEKRDVTNNFWSVLMWMVEDQLKQGGTGFSIQMKSGEILKVTLQLPDEFYENILKENTLTDEERKQILEELNNLEFKVSEL